MRDVNTVLLGYIDLNQTNFFEKFVQRVVNV